MLSSKEMRFVQFFETTIKGAGKTGRKMPVTDSTLKKYKFIKNDVRHRHFSAYILKVFKKHQTVAM